MAVVAQSHIQDAVHPLLRHPRPIKRDPAKAQRMLTLVADSEAQALQRERSQTTRWLERPMYQHLETPDLSLGKEVDIEAHPKNERRELNAEESDSDLLDRWTNPDRQESLTSWDMGPGLAESRTSMDEPATRQPLPQPSGHLRTSTWAAPTSIPSDNTTTRPSSNRTEDVSPRTGSYSSSGSLRPDARLLHSRSWGASTQLGNDTRPVSMHLHHSSYTQGSTSSFESPLSTERRPRPSSFATYNVRDRPTSKIASSRGLKNNSYPNLSRPISGLAMPAVPGEHMEDYTTAQRIMDGEFNSSPVVSPHRAGTDVFEDMGQATKTEKKKKKRWSSIPNTFKNIAKSRFSLVAENPRNVTSMEDLRQMSANQSNFNTRYEEPSGPSPRSSYLASQPHLPTPNHSPLKTDHPYFADPPLAPPPKPWAEFDGPLTPPASLHKRKSSGLSTLMTMGSLPHSPTTLPNPSRPASLVSRRSSGMSTFTAGGAPQPRLTLDVSAPLRTSTPQINTPIVANTPRRGTPSQEQTCLMCKASKPPSEFMTRRITANCWHDPATCIPCLEAWIQHCVATRGWEMCSCPECGENMASGDVGAFTSGSAFYSG